MNFEFKLSDKELPQGFTEALNAANVIDEDAFEDDFAGFSMIIGHMGGDCPDVVPDVWYYNMTQDGVLLAMAKACAEAAQDEPNNYRMWFEISVGDDNVIATLEEIF